MSLVGQALGPIVIESRLGVGGMGEVYRGFDRRLERQVAVKTLRDGGQLSDEAKARLRREARILSSLDHPGICRIHELLETDLGDFLVLELIEGHTLSEVMSRELPHDRRLEIGQRIAEALSAAHRSGVIHRDLKPDNVMVTAEGEVKVLDFGVARSLDPEEDLGEAPAEGADFTEDDPGDFEPTRTFRTQRGSVVGTLRFMSPEQAASGVVTTGSDQFSFGLLLQELMTGAPAYEAREARQLQSRVLRAETRPAPDLDDDVSALLADLLALTPEDRPTAGETAMRLAEIRRKPERLRKLRWRIGIAAAVIAVIAVAAGVAISSRLEARKRAEIARQFSSEVAEVEWLLRVASTVPLHDMRDERQRVRAKMQELERTMEQLGPRAEGPGRYALGRGHLALGDSAAASRELEAAWRLGERDPEVAYALGLALSHLYERELERIKTLERADDRGALRRDAELRFRDPAVEYLRAGQGAEGESQAYAEGLLALFDDRLPQALEKAREAAEDVPWLWEAKVLEARVEAEVAARERTVGNYAATTAAFDRAVVAAEEAVEIAPSSALAHLALCSLHVEILSFELYDQAGDPPTSFGRADDACGAATIAEQDRAAVHVTRARALTLYGEWSIRSSSDARTTLIAAVAAAETAVGLDPAGAEGYRELASALWRRGKFEVLTTDDVSPWFDRAIEAASSAVSLAPDDPMSHLFEGLPLIDLGIVKVNLGEDPREVLDDAEESFSRAIELSPELGRAWGGAALASYVRALWESSLGIETDADLALASERLERALAINPNHPNSHRFLAEVENERGLAALAAGRDGQAHFERSAHHLARDQELQPADAERLYEVAFGLYRRAEAEMGAGLDPNASFTGAREALDQVRSQRMEWWAATALEAQLSTLEARALITRGQPPSSILAEARKQIAEAREQSPNSPLPLRVRAEIELTEARWHAARGNTAPATRQFEIAESWARRARSLEKEDATASWILLANCALERAKVTADPSARHRAANEARSALDEALARRPGHAGEWREIDREIETIRGGATAPQPQSRAH